jgi:hypothetical protein
MKLFNFLNFKKNNLPPLKSLRPPVFDTDFFWFVALGIAVVIFLITALIGFQFFYSQYFESYKQSQSAENYENLIDINKLKSTIEKRNEFLNQEIILPKDPSL